jgi:hypothetical protein
MSVYARRTPILNAGAGQHAEHLARNIMARGSVDDLPADTEDGSDSMINIMLVVLGLVFLCLILASSFFLFRRYRMKQRMQADILPSYYDSKHQGRSNHNPHGLTIETTHNGRSSMIYISRNGQPMLANPNSPPHSPDNVPEIHITFPDEQDDQGRPKSGRVLYVRVGDNATVGLEPMHNEQLPAYEKEAKGGFYSVDMDQIGGLKEKDRTLFQ